MDGEKNFVKILSIGNFGYGWDGSICDEEHIAQALEELGHEVTRVQRDEVSMHSGTNDYDFTLVSQWDGYGNLSWLPKPLVYWAFDFQADGQEWHERLVDEADLYLSKRIADSKHPNWQWLSQDFAPKFLDKHPAPLDKDIDVLFTGSYLPWATERNETIRAVNDNYKLVIHSVNAWPEEWNLDVRPPKMDMELPELYARAKVILSIDHTIEAGYWSDRNAQIMACGRTPLFRYVPLSEARFGSDIFYFYTPEHCIRCIQEIMAMPAEDIDMFDDQAYVRAGMSLIVKDRARDLLRIVEGIL